MNTFQTKGLLSLPSPIQGHYFGTMEDRDVRGFRGNDTALTVTLKTTTGERKDRWWKSRGKWFVTQG